MSEYKVLSVSQVNKYIKNLLEEDLILQDILLEGEVSNFKKHATGNLFFVLKDKNACLNCMIFKNLNFDFQIRDGMKLLIYGCVKFYEKSGQYRLIADYVQALGRGDVHNELEELKNKLEREGLFDKANKKIIPEIINCVAIITSDTGAAVRDIIKISRDRNKIIKLIIVPSLVQGKDAPDNISRAIKRVELYNQELYNQEKIEVIILARGGGSLEDLYAFNDERVVRAVFNSKIPIVSAIGHETDYTLTDFASDLRAATPSEAAELIIPDINNLKNKLLNTRELLKKQSQEKINFLKQDLKHAREILNKSLRDYITRLKKNILIKKDLLEKIAPNNILKRGYVLIYDLKENHNINLEKIKVDQEIKIKFYNGEAIAKIISCDKKTGE